MQTSLFEPTGAREEVIKLVFSFYNNKKLLTKPDKKVLKKFFSIQLNEDKFSFAELDYEGR